MTISCDDEAKEFRAFVRGIAKLPCEWDRASDGMRDWYRSLAKRYGDKVGQARK